MAWTIPTHITLLPPTQVAVRRTTEIEQHLREVAALRTAFEVSLRGTDTFRPVTQTSFVVVDRGSRQCEVLAEAVRSGPLRRRLPYPYHPHVTLAVDLEDGVHDLAESEFSSFQLDFAVESFERFELTDHGVWESTARFWLGDPVTSQPP